MKRWWGESEQRSRPRKSPEEDDQNLVVEESGHSVGERGPVPGRALKKLMADLFKQRSRPRKSPEEAHGQSLQ